MAARSNKMEAPNDKDMLNFLSKVDEIDSLIKDMTSGDSNLEKSAFEKADKFLGNDTKKTHKSSVGGFDRSVVNKYEDDKKKNTNKDGPTFTEDSISPDEFMKRMEEDSVERQRKRASDEKEANKLKELGNKSFKSQEFEAAIKHYSNAIDLIKDNKVYYTNRAQAYIKVKEYEKALDDCLTAQMLDKKFVKAYVHQGKALQNLNRFDEAITYFENIGKIDKRHLQLVEGYVNEVHEARRSHGTREELRSLSENRDEIYLEITEIFENLREKEDLCTQEIIKLISRLRKLIINDAYKALFRAVNGFQVIDSNPRLARILKSLNDSEEEDECRYQTIELFTLVCADNEKNTISLMIPSTLLLLKRCLRSSSALKVRISTLCLIHAITQSVNGRMFLMEDGKDGRNILEDLMSLLGHGGEISVVAVGVINNLALSDKIDQDLVEDFKNKFLPFVIQMMDILSELDQETALQNSMLDIMPNSLSTVANLSRNQEFRECVEAKEDIWSSSAKLLGIYEPSMNSEKKRKVVNSLLGLLINITASGPSLKMNFIIDLHDSCVSLLVCNAPQIVERSSGLLSRLMSCSVKLIDHVIKRRTFISFISVLTCENAAAKKNIIKCIALCTSKSSEPIKELMKKEAMDNLLKLIKSNDEKAAGNAALCIGDSAKNETFTKLLVKTEVVKDLLYVATNEKFQNQVRHNAAIAIGKLANSNARLLEKLRDLHGLEILHQVLQANKD